MSKLISMFVIKQCLSVLAAGLLVFLMTLSVAMSANAADEVALNLALEAARAQVPGKVVAHEKADERVGIDGAKTLQPVYRVKIFSQQGVMKTVFVHRQSGQVVE